MERWDKHEKELTDRVSGHASLMKKTVTWYNYACLEETCNFVEDITEKRSLNAERHMIITGHIVDRKEYEVGNPTSR